MQEQITIKLPKDVLIDLEDTILTQGRTSNEIIMEAIKDYLFFQKYNLLRKKMILKAKSQGINSEEDIFNQVS